MDIQVKRKKLLLCVTLALISISLIACGDTEKTQPLTPGEERKVEMNGKEYDVKTNTTGDGAEIKLGE